MHVGEIKLSTFGILYSELYQSMCLHGPGTNIVSLPLYTLVDAPNSGIVLFIHPLPIIICSNAVGCHQAGPEECHGDRCQLQGLW